MEQFQTYRSFFTNEAIIASIGGNVRAWKEDEEQEEEDANDTRD